MKRLLLLTILFSSISIYGNDTASTKSRRIFIGANFSADHCYRALTKNDRNFPNDQWTMAKKFDDSVEVPKFGYTAGITFGFQINKRISIETGIQYSNKGYKTIPIMTAYNWNEAEAIATNIINYSYLDFPLRVNFSFLKKRIQILASIGTALNCLVQTSTKTIPETPTITFKTKTNVSLYPYKKINISPMASVGLKYKINTRMNLRVEPTFRFSMLNIDAKSYRTTHLWSAGLNIGYYIDL